MMTDALIDAYEACLQTLEMGASLEEALARYPALARELRPLLSVALEGRTLAAKMVLPRSVEMAHRARFLTQAAQLRPVPPLRRWLTWRTAWAGLAVVFVVGAGTYGVAAASAQSLPGDVLYGVKRTVEQTQLLLTADPQARARLEVEFADRRLGEVQTVTEQKRIVLVEFTGRISSLLVDRWAVSNVTVLIQPTTRVEGLPRLGAYVHVNGLTQADGAISAETVTVLLEASDGNGENTTPTVVPTKVITGTSTETEPATSTAPPTATDAPTETEPATPTTTPASTPTSEDDDTPTATPMATSAPRTPEATPTPPAAQGESVEFTGQIEAINGSTWQISGRTVTVNAATVVHGSEPKVGRMVEVKALQTAQGLVARELEVHDATDKPKPSPTPENLKTPEAPKTPTPSRTPEPNEDETHEASETPKPSRTPGSRTPEPDETHDPSETPGP